MTMINPDSLIALFQRMYDEHWRYVAGAAKEGEVDCSGAFVWAYQQFGKKIAHGSNAIARGYVEGLLPIADAVPGMAAFKVREPGHNAYALPDKYRKGGSAYNGDLNDYYHIGLVDETGKYVLNAQGTKAGFTRTKLSSWACVGRLNAVNYAAEEEMTPMQDMIVTAANGGNVWLRAKPDKASKAVDSIPVGTHVLAGEETTNGWRPVVYNAMTGYMMAEFLTAPGEETPGAPAFVRTLTAEEYSRLCDARDEIEDALKTLKTIVGVG